MIFKDCQESYFHRFYICNLLFKEKQIGGVTSADLLFILGYKDITMHLLKNLTLSRLFIDFSLVFLIIMQTSCHPAGTEGRSDVKATCVGVDIQDLACKVKARNQLTFKGFRIDFLKTDASFGDKGLSQ